MAKRKKAPELTPAEQRSLQQSEAAWEAIQAEKAKLSPEELAQIEQENEWLLRRTATEIAITDGQGPSASEVGWLAWQHDTDEDIVQIAWARKRYDTLTLKELAQVLYDLDLYRHQDKEGREVPIPPTILRRRLRQAEKVGLL